MASFYAFPVIFIDTVTFKKGTLIKRAGVRTPWTPPGSAPDKIIERAIILFRMPIKLARHIPDVENVRIIESHQCYMWGQVSK